MTDLKRTDHRGSTVRTTTNYDVVRVDDRRVLFGGIQSLAGACDLAEGAIRGGPTEVVKVTTVTKIERLAVATFGGKS